MLNRTRNAGTHRPMDWLRVRRLVLTASVVFTALAVQFAYATPTRDKKNKGTLKWPKGTTITVYVEPDPAGLGRDAAVKKGIEKWKGSKTIKDREIKIDVKVEKPPDELPANSVVAKWVDGSSIKNNPATGGCRYSEKGGENVVHGGTIKLNKDEGAFDTRDAESIGVHEFGHVLGLADVDTDDAAMNRRLPEFGVRDVTPADERELGSVYAAAASDTGLNMFCDVQQEGDHWRYLYTAHWEWGGELALFQVDTGGAELFDFVVPHGWLVEPGLGDDVVNYADDEEVLGPSLEGYSIGDPNVSFVLSDEVSYLGPDLSLLSWGFCSYGPPVPGHGFLAGTFETLRPAPGLPALALVGAVPIAGGLVRRLRRR